MTRQALTSTDALPEGPYTVGLTKGPGSYSGPPWTVCCGDGRAICGSVHSRETAERIAEALDFMAKNHPA